MTPRVPAAPVTFPVANAISDGAAVEACESPGSAIDPHADRAARARLAGGAELGQVSSRGLVIVPEFFPARPPTKLSAPPLTSPVAEEPVIVSWLLATRPPAVLPVARPHISERDGGLDGTGIAADEQPAACRFATFGPSHIAARKRVGNHALTGATPTLICANRGHLTL